MNQAGAGLFTQKAGTQTNSWAMQDEERQNADALL